MLDKFDKSLQTNMKQWFWQIQNPFIWILPHWIQTNRTLHMLTPSNFMSAAPKWSLGRSPYRVQDGPHRGQQWARGWEKVSLCCPGNLELIKAWLRCVIKISQQIKRKQTRIDVKTGREVKLWRKHAFRNTDKRQWDLGRCEEHRALWSAGVPLVCAWMFSPETVPGTQGPNHELPSLSGHQVHPSAFAKGHLRSASLLMRSLWGGRSDTDTSSPDPSNSGRGTEERKQSHSFTNHQGRHFCVS